VETFPITGRPDEEREKQQKAKREKKRTKRGINTKTLPEKMPPFSQLATRRRELEGGLVQSQPRRQLWRNPKVGREKEKRPEYRK